MCLIFETMEAVTTSLMITSAVAYSAQLGTTTTLATIQGIVGGIYYGVGEHFNQNFNPQKFHLISEFFKMNFGSGNVGSFWRELTKSPAIQKLFVRFG